MLLFCSFERVVSVGVVREKLFVFDNRLCDRIGKKIMFKKSKNKEFYLYFIFVDILKVR